MKIGLLALAALAVATSASAAPSDNPFAQDKAVLDLKGLDLATADGQQRLAIRIDQAARAVCGDHVSSVHLALEAKAQACRAAVVADVRAQIETRVAAAKAPTQLASLR
ncbi:UrcA family protein [Sphingobium subterraneum]|uniref:UrcA family protein n=1 Tax=Sphingobium subterraneum TaxID=627688 RepID=A0A841J131_9SPHN|nr:UrcA family protein [Sphingobium subterraneum]MBB6124052.1 UrcA family protein [Sphingobium subterraneum]